MKNKQTTTQTIDHPKPIGKSFHFHALVSEEMAMNVYTFLTINTTENPLSSYSLSQYAVQGSRNKVFPLPLKCSQIPQTPKLLIVKSMLSSPLTLCCFQYSSNVLIFYHHLSWPVLQFCLTKGPRILGKELNRGVYCEYFLFNYILQPKPSPSPSGICWIQIKFRGFIPLFSVIRVIKEDSLGYLKPIYL